MFFTKVYGDAQSTKCVSNLNMLLGYSSVSHDSGAFSNDSLLPISSLGHGLQKGSVKSRTKPSCCPVPFPSLRVCGDVVS